jgi:phosphonate transport system substrate-binding protein
MQKYIFGITILALSVLLLPGSLICADKPVLRVGVASMITPVSAVRYYQQIVDYLADKLEMQGEMVHRTTYDEIDRMLEQKEVDVAFICSAPYVQDRDTFGVELLAAPVVDGKTTYHSDIIVHKDSAISSFDDLAGKTFAFVDPKSNTGRLYPLYLLATKGKTPDLFFSRYFFSYSHNKSVEMVAKKKVDGASVDSVVYAYMLAENSPYARQTKIIHQSPEFGIPPVVVPPGLPLYLKKKIQEIFITMHRDPVGKKILGSMRIERFIEVPDSNYDLIREMRVFLKKDSEFSSTMPSDSILAQLDPNLIVHFSVIPRDNPRLAYEKYQPLMDYLSRESGMQFELLLKNTYEDTVRSLGEGETDFALLSPLTYLDAYNRFGTPPILKSITGEGNPYYYSVIVIPSGAEVKSLSDLEGKRLAFASLWSTSGNLMPRYMLAREGIHLEELKRYNNFNYHETVVKKVLSREYDAGGIRKSVADRYLQFGLRVIAVSEPIPTGPVVVSPETPYAVVQKIRKTLLTMKDREDGRQVLRQLDPDLQGGFISASDADYSGIRKMINDVPKGCGIGCHPKAKF